MRNRVGTALRAVRSQAEIRILRQGTMRSKGDRGPDNWRGCLIQVQKCNYGGAACKGAKVGCIILGWRVAALGGRWQVVSGSRHDIGNSEWRTAGQGWPALPEAGRQRPKSKGDRGPDIWRGYLLMTAGNTPVTGPPLYLENYFQPSTAGTRILVAEGRKADSRMADFWWPSPDTFRLYPPLHFCTGHRPSCTFALR